MSTTTVNADFCAIQGEESGGFLEHGVLEAPPRPEPLYASENDDRKNWICQRSDAVSEEGVQNMNKVLLQVRGQRRE